MEWNVCLCTDLEFGVNRKNIVQRGYNVSKSKKNRLNPAAPVPALFLRSLRPLSSSLSSSSRSRGNPSETPCRWEGRKPVRCCTSSSSRCSASPATSSSTPPPRAAAPRQRMPRPAAARWAPPSASRRTSPSSSPPRGKPHLYPPAGPNLWPFCIVVGARDLLGNGICVWVGMMGN